MSLGRPDGLWRACGWLLDCKTVSYSDLHTPTHSFGGAAGSPSANGRFEGVITGASKKVSMAGLPPHLCVVNDRGKPTHSTREQFYKGKASKKKRGR